jgi:hypothetical protein
MDLPIRRWSVLALVATVLLAGCSGGTPKPTSTATEEGPSIAIEPTSPPPTEEPLPGATPTSTEAEEGAVEPTSTTSPEAPPATARPSLHATDPTTVNLGSGKPTLVEFFAFW